MLRVETERDRVLLVFAARGRDLCLAPDQARRLAEAIDRAAGFCAAWVAAGGARRAMTGEVVDCLVRSWDGRVNVRFGRAVDRLPLRFEDARRLAAEVRAKAPEAEARATIVWRPNLLGV